MDREPGERSKPKPEFLIEEYKVCREYASHMDATSWQMGAVLIPITVAGLAYLFSVSAPEGFARAIIVAIVSAISIAVLWSFLELFKRWFGYQQVAYYRMLQIEEELGFWLVTYAHVMRGEIKSDGNERLTRLVQRFDKFPRRGNQQMVIFVVYVLIAGWILLTIMEFVRVILNL